MLRVLELYSGIGGFHYALEESQILHEVIGAADVNNVANDIYRHNFRNTKILQRSIESITMKELDKLSPDLIHMSPPCQPFARVGKQQDSKDKRTKSFLHLIEVIPQMKNQPKYLFMENVKGFDTSDTRDVLLEMLGKSGYLCQEFMLSPLQFGIPNSRLRYYLLAKLQPSTFGFDMSNQIWDRLPLCAAPFLKHRVAGGSPDTCSDEPCKQITSNDTDVPSPEKTGANSIETTQLQNQRTSEENSELCESLSGASELERTGDIEIGDTSLSLREKCQYICRDLGEFLEKAPSDYFSQYLIPQHFLPRFWVMDIVKPLSRISCCFTKRYGHHIEGAGSVLQTNEQSRVDLTQYKRDRQYTEAVESGVASLGLRFFTPREIANLMCFPDKLNFPLDVTTIQRYRVLGNSLNVHVVAVLLRLLVFGDS